MRNRVERLRIWLLGSAVFLVVVIAAFVGSARYLQRRFLVNLPAKLGVNVVRETNGYTYCQSVQGRTAYCIHAASAVEHTDGKVALHDVSITLYGSKGDRGDRIYGDEFEYDQKSGVIRANGVVHIDLQAAADAGVREGPSGRSSAKVMHVTTSGLMYLEKLGVAATNAPITFESVGITGHAVGADYASDSGMLMLHSEVSMNAVEGGRAVQMTASAAQFDEHRQEAYLTQATYASAGRTASADGSTLHRRSDGTLSRVEAQGHVTIAAQGGTVAADRADVALTGASQPEMAVLTGGVRYSADGALRQVRGQAEEARIGFDGQARPQPADAVFTGAVRLTERTRATEAAKEPWSTRELTAGRVEAALVASGTGASELRDVHAMGSPRVTLVNNGSLASSAGQGTTEVSADDLAGHFVAVEDAKETPQLETIVGRGHTVLRQMSVDGLEQRSAGDSLDAKMRAQSAAGVGKQGGAGRQIGDSLASAVQQGHVTMMRRVPAKSVAALQAAGKTPRRASGGDDVQRATSERAAYDGDLDRMTLTGGVELMDAGSELWANRVILEHETGDAHATGAVKMNYVGEISDAGRTEQRAAEPTHVLADRADLDRTNEVGTFYGRPVRMWQGGNQVQAPVVEFSRVEKRMTARGDAAAGGSSAAQVHTVLTGSGASSGPSGLVGDGGKASGGVGCAAGKTDAGGVRASAPTANAVRIASGGLIYSGILRRADFTGGFRAETMDGTIRAGAGTVYLRQSGASAGGEDAGGASLAGDVDRVVATGRVELAKPGLTATGDRLVYTASDRVGLLTGDEKAPPRAVDAEGTTTGAELVFRGSCDGTGGGSVEVLGGPGLRAHTDARMVEDGTKEKGKR